MFAGCALAAMFSAVFAQTPLVDPLLAGPALPRGRFEPGAPLPGLPAVTLDANGDGYGIAQQTARSKNLQARILWIDATANVARINTNDKIAALIDKAKYAGFNTIVLDVKPIIGFTLWPSKIAPKLMGWRGQSFGDFDPLASMVFAAKKAGMPLFVCLNAFSEGHRDLEQGPGYDHPEWQTVLYEIQGAVQSASDHKATFSLVDRIDQMPATENELGVFNDLRQLPAKLPANSKLVIVDSGGNVLAQADGAAVHALAVVPPPGGSALVGFGRASDFLRLYGKPDDRLLFECAPDFVPIGKRPWQQVPLMVNPNDPAVRRRELSLLEELLQNYEVDGVMYDDRLRYAGMNADFSDVTRRQFESYVGEKITWPDDVFRWNLLPDLSRGIVPGKWYDAWLAFRAQTLKSFIVDARKVVQRVRPNAVFGVYAGSSYGDYGPFASNYASADFEAGFRYLTPAYQKAGFAEQLDFIITGCYYSTATIAEAMSQNVGVGYTVEAAGQLSNRVARDQAWVYAGIAVDQFKGDQTKLQNALQAAVASTQGVMIFDLSHDLDKVWNVFQQAFTLKADPPHSKTGLLAEIRRRRALLDKQGVREPPVVISSGSSSAGM